MTIDTFSCAYCGELYIHTVFRTAAALQHHEDTQHAQATIARLRAQLQLANELAASTQELLVACTESNRELQETLDDQALIMGLVTDYHASYRWMLPYLANSRPADIRDKIILAMEERSQRRGC